MLEDDTLPEMARDLFRFQAREYASVEARLDEIEAKLMKWHREDDVSRRIATIPGVGPIGSAMLSMKAPPPETFRSGRDFAAWLGLTPKDHSTGGRQRHGGITKAGDSGLRSTLIVGATALLRHIRKGRHKPTPWLTALLERKPPKLVAVALANKFARIAWRLMVWGGFTTGRWPTGPPDPKSAPTSEAARRIAHELAGRSRWNDRSVDTRELPKVTPAPPNVAHVLGACVANTISASGRCPRKQAGHLRASDQVRSLLPS